MTPIDITGLTIFLGIISSMICGIITLSIGSNKGYGIASFWWGFFLGIVGIIVEAVRPINK